MSARGHGKKHRIPEQWELVPSPEAVRIVKEVSEATLEDINAVRVRVYPIKPNHAFKCTACDKTYAQLCEEAAIRFDVPIGLATPFWCKDELYAAHKWRCVDCGRNRAHKHEPCS